MDEETFAPNETLQLHELLTFKSLCLTKSTAMSPLVSDKKLKGILQQDIKTTEQHIQELKELMEENNERID